MLNQTCIDSKGGFLEPEKDRPRLDGGWLGYSAGPVSMWQRTPRPGSPPPMSFADVEQGFCPHTSSLPTRAPTAAATATRVNPGGLPRVAVVEAAQGTDAYERL
jgi:hypothetical protein